jgi:hypothetical protein
MNRNLLNSAISPASIEFSARRIIFKTVIIQSVL